jgi:LysM repeat protein
MSRTVVILDAPKRLCYHPRLKENFKRWMGTIQKERPMSTMHLRKMVPLGMILISLVFAGCERSASTAPAATDTGGLTQEEISQKQTMDAVRTALLAQTAQPTGTEPPTIEPTATVPPPTNTPSGPTETPPVVYSTATEDGGGEATYIVQPGDSVYSVARTYGVDPDDIISRNNLQYPYYLEVGQELIIPTGGTSPGGPTNTPPAGGRQHVVQQGEWLYSIARKYGVSWESIAEANNLVYPYTVYPGDILYIP